MVRDDQPDAREGQAGRRGVTERFVVPVKPGNAGGGKTGLNVDLVLEAIVKRLPPPKGDETAPLKALLVNSWYDAYLGVVVLVRVVDGSFRKGMRIRMMGSGAAYEVDRLGVFTPKMTEADGLGPGEIGYITAQIKQVADTKVGDTITDDRRPTAAAVPGFKPAQTVVFCGLFPTDAADFEASMTPAFGRSVPLPPAAPVLATPVSSLIARSQRPARLIQPFFAPASRFAACRRRPSDKVVGRLRQARRTRPPPAWKFRRLENRHWRPRA